MEDGVPALGDIKMIDEGDAMDEEDEQVITIGGFYSCNISTRFAVTVHSQMQ